MNLKRIFKSFVLLLFLGFTFLFFSSNNGYYEYQLKEKTFLTEEAVKKFEEDIKNGKNVDIDSYINKEDKNYDNGISKLNQKISNKISSLFSTTLKCFFKYITSKLEE